jgi:two-component system phosphate regulon response regulator PhoB
VLSLGVARRALVIEDEDDLRHTLELNLRREGFTVIAAATGAAGLAAATSERPDVIVLDLMLPDLSGVEICRKLRQDEATRSVPIVMLTARDEEIDRVVGFEVGADDYVTKPFSMRELMLRIHARLRGREGGDEVTELGRLSLDIGAHRAFVDGAEVALTALEFKLLRTLMERRGRVQSRDVLLTDVWEVSLEVTTRTVDTHIKRLREKLGPAVGRYIETVRGVGYRMIDQVTPGEAEE